MKKRMECFNSTLYLKNASPIVTEGGMSAHTVSRVKFYVMDVVVPSMCALGLVGNLLSLVVLATEKLHRTLTKMEKSTHIGLMALAVSDFSFCLLVLLFTQASLKPFYEMDNAMIYFDYLANGLITLFIISSTWLIVVMAAERYIAVCHPLRARKLISLKRTRVSVAIVFVFCALSTIPIFMERRISQVYCNDGRLVNVLTERNEEFVRLRRLLWAVVYDFIPSTSLVYFNICLILQIRKASALRNQMSPKHPALLYRTNANKTIAPPIESTHGGLVINNRSKRVLIINKAKSRISLHPMNATDRADTSSQSNDNRNTGNTEEDNDGNTNITFNNQEDDPSYNCKKPKQKYLLRFISDNREEQSNLIDGSYTETVLEMSQNGRVSSAITVPRKRPSDPALNGVNVSRERMSNTALNGVNVSRERMSNTALNGVNVSRERMSNTALNGVNVSRERMSNTALNGVNVSRKRLSDTALNSVTATLVAIVLLFLLLVSPSELLKFSVSYSPVDRNQKLIVTYVTNFMQVLNFSLNFVLYCAVNKSFRQTVRRLICCHRHNVPR